MEDNLKCPICIEFANSPVVTNCCHQIFCGPCIRQVSRCPNCRAPLSGGYRNCPLAERLIANLPSQCQYCRLRATHADVTQHEIVCPKRQIDCPAENCHFHGPVPKFLEHLAHSHKEELLKNADKCLTAGCTNDQDCDVVSLEAYGSPASSV